MQGRVLLVDDDRDLGETLVAALRRRGLAVTWKRSAEAALAALDEETWNVVATDITMGGMSGLGLCERLVANRPDLPVVLMTAFGTLEVAIDAIRAGAYDFVTKPFEIEVLALALQRAIDHGALREEVKRLRDVVAHTTGQAVDGMIGTSAVMRRVYDLIEQVAASDTTVLITGPSGTGKELVARALHARGRRRGGPFVAVNCAAIPETLLESELFGHAKGAFTDARAARRGLFLQASGGTLFLDEVADLPLGMQPKLLRALQERTVRAVGGDEEVSYDVRLITATNADLEAEVAKRTFREDLFYRINVVRIDLPLLSLRGNDILLLAQHFVRRAALQIHKHVTGISTAAAEKLLAYGWPGNVRELENNMERAVALARNEELTVDDLPDKLRDYRAPQGAAGGAEPELLPMAEIERRHILRVLKAVGGSKALAAEVLGLDRSTLYRKLDHYVSAARLDV